MIDWIEKDEDGLYVAIGYGQVTGAKYSFDTTDLGEYDRLMHEMEAEEESALEEMASRGYEYV